MLQRANSREKSRRYRRLGRCAFAVALFVAGAGFVAERAAAGEVLLDGIAAQVGSEIVLISEVSQVAAPIEIRMRRSAAGEGEIRAMRSEVLERLIEARLVEGVVEQLELGATDVEITEAIEAIAANTGLTLSQLARSVESHGLSLAEYREKIKSEIERSKVLNTMVRSRVRVEPYEVRALFVERYSGQPTGGKEIRLYHLLVASGADTMRDHSTACRLATTAREAIASGNASFTQVARDLSDSNRESGGDVGWVHVDQLAGWMARNIDRLETGAVSEVVETPFGCNLLMVTERRNYEPATFEQVEAKLEEELFDRNTETEYIRWIALLREDTYIERKGIFAEASRLEGRAGSAARSSAQ